MSAPAITILLPVWNGAAFLHETIPDLLRQTWSDFELLVVDDGSTDDTSGIAAHYARRDRRVVVERIEHGGIVGALNTGLRRARGAFVARADADDPSHPDRLRVQLRAMERRPEVGILGAWVRLTGSMRGRWTPPPATAAIRAQMLFVNPMLHPTVMMRRTFLDRHGLAYEPALGDAEDYDLWERASRAGPLMNVARVLVRHHVHPGQVSSTRAEAQRAALRQVHARQLRSLGIEPDAATLDQHYAVAWGLPHVVGDAVPPALEWLRRLSAANESARAYPQKALAAEIAQRAAVLLRRRTLTRYWQAAVRRVDRIRPGRW